MGWKSYFVVGLYLLFFLGLVIVGTNISAQQLALTVNEEIPLPFLVAPQNDGTVNLEIMGDSYQFSVFPIQNSYSLLKSSIQNTLVTVKFNLAPRVEFLRYHLSNGLEQLGQDLTKIIP